MLLAHWLASFRPSSFFRKSRPRHRRHQLAEIQALEERILLAAPIALDDYFEQNYNSSNPGLNTFNYVVMNNDYDPDNDFIQVEWVSGPSVGELVEFQAGGSFTWIPPAEWVGTATFSYRIYEVGTPKVYGNTATVTMKLTGALPAKADPTDGAFRDCGCRVPTAHSSETNPHPILHFQIDDGSSSPAYYEATLVVDGNTVVTNQRFDVTASLTAKRSACRCSTAASGARLPRRTAQPNGGGHRRSARREFERAVQNSLRNSPATVPRRHLDRSSHDLRRLRRHASGRRLS